MGAKIDIINGFDKVFDFNFKADTLKKLATNPRIFLILFGVMLNPDYVSELRNRGLKLL